MEVIFDWDAEGRDMTADLQRKLEEGIPISAWQAKEVVSYVSKVFSDILGIALGVQHYITSSCPPGGGGWYARPPDQHDCPYRRP